MKIDSQVISTPARSWGKLPLEGKFKITQIPTKLLHVEARSFWSSTTLTFVLIKNANSRAQNTTLQFPLENKQYTLQRRFPHSQVSEYAAWNSSTSILRSNGKCTSRFASLNPKQLWTTKLGKRLLKQTRLWFCSKFCFLFNFQNWITSWEVRDPVFLNVLLSRYS